MDITGVQLALYLTLASAAMLLGAWVLLLVTLRTRRAVGLRALIQPYRAAGWAILPQSLSLIDSEGKCTAACRASPASVNIPRQFAGRWPK